MAKRLMNTRSKKVSHKGNTFGAVLRGLQLKWTILLTMLMFGLAILGDAMIRQSVERLVFYQQVTSAHEQCAALADLNTIWNLHYHDKKALSTIAERYESEKSILYVQFFSLEGIPLTPQDGGKLHPHSIGRTLSDLVDKPRLHTQTNNAPPYLDVVHAVTFDSQERKHTEPPSSPQDVAGYIRLGIDLSDVQDELAAFFQNVRYAGIIAILLMIPLAFMIVRRVAAPVNELNGVVNQLAEGDFRVRAHIKRGDEIGQLANSFNSMADQLSTSNDRLVKLNAELEDRVLQRTRQLKDLAARDPLTGLYNRRHLSEFLARRFSESERYGTNLSCMMIDMDNFKYVNDQHGHEMGDTLLILTASVISVELRESDMASRFGGDEFCVLLPQTTAEQAQKLAERIVEKYQQVLEKQLPGQTQHCGMSIGIAGLQELHLVHQDELIKAADQALYGAKEAGKNRVQLAETLA